MIIVGPLPSCSFVGDIGGGMFVVTLRGWEGVEK